MGIEKRRSERLAGRFVVVVREKLATWVTTTEDVSARGCRIELKRPLTPGQLVQLVFEMGEGVDPLVVHGQVAWARRSPPHSAGVAFLSVPRTAQDEPARPGAWIDRLLAAYVRRIQETPPAPARLATPTPTPPPTMTPAPGRTAVLGRVTPPAEVIVPPPP
jgi:hypothetical protein